MTRTCFQCGQHEAQPRGFYCSDCVRETARRRFLARAEQREAWLRAAGVPTALVGSKVVPAPWKGERGWILEGSPGGNHQETAVGVFALYMGEVAKSPDFAARRNWVQHCAWRSAPDLLDSLQHQEVSLDDIARLQLLGLSDIGSESRTAWRVQQLWRLLEARAQARGYFVGTTIYPAASFVDLYGREGERILAALQALGTWRTTWTT